MDWVIFRVLMFKINVTCAIGKLLLKASNAARKMYIRIIMSVGLMEKKASEMLDDDDNFKPVLEDGYFQAVRLLRQIEMEGRR